MKVYISGLLITASTVNEMSVLGPPGSSQEERRNQKEPEGARRSQEEPGGARRSQEEPRGAKRSQEEPGGARTSQVEPGGARTRLPKKNSKNNMVNP